MTTTVPQGAIAATARTYAAPGYDAAHTTSSEVIGVGQLPWGSVCAGSVTG